MLNFKEIRDELREAAPYMSEKQLRLLAATAMLYAEIARRPGWRWKEEGRRHDSPASLSRQGEEPSYRAV